MTNAYIEGFCKAAESYGVDPYDLLASADYMNKQAAGFASLGKALKAIGSAGRAIGRNTTGLRRSVGRAVGGFGAGPTVGESFGRLGTSIGNYGKAVGAVPGALAKDIGRGARNMFNAGKDAVTTFGSNVANGARVAGKNTLSWLRNNGAGLAAGAMGGYMGGRMAQPAVAAQPELAAN